MRNLRTTIGNLRGGFLFPAWDDALEMADDEAVTVFEDGSVDAWESGDALAPKFLNASAKPAGWDQFWDTLGETWEKREEIIDIDL